MRYEITLLNKKSLGTVVERLLEESNGFPNAFSHMTIHEWYSDIIKIVTLFDLEHSIDELRKTALNFAKFVKTKILSPSDIQLCTELLYKKNNDYAGDGDMLNNFLQPALIMGVRYHNKLVFTKKTAEIIVHGFISRIGDKVSRILTLYKASATRKVSDETLEDTKRDLFNYLLLFVSFLDRLELHPE